MIMDYLYFLFMYKGGWQCSWRRSQRRRGGGIRVWSSGSNCIRRRFVDMPSIRPPSIHQSPPDFLLPAGCPEWLTLRFSLQIQMISSMPLRIFTWITSIHENFDTSEAPEVQPWAFSASNWQNFDTFEAPKGETSFFSEYLTEFWYFCSASGETSSFFSVRLTEFIERKSWYL